MNVLTWTTNKDPNLNWVAKVVNVKNHPEVEIRAYLKCQILIKVTLGGFWEKTGWYSNSPYEVVLSEKNVRISQNGTSYWSLEDLVTLNKAIEEAVVYLEKLKFQND